MATATPDPSNREERRYTPAEQSADVAPLTREDRRSLWLNQAIAKRVREDPERALRLARTNLVRLQAQHPRGQAAKMLAVWARLLLEPMEVLLLAMLSTTQEGRDLRVNSPFAGVLEEQERRAALDAFYKHERATRGQSRSPQDDEPAAGQHPYDALMGPFYDTAGVAHLLGAPETAIKARCDEGTLLALPTSDDHWIYPTFQFEGHQVHPRLIPAIQALRDADPYAAALWFVMGNPDLDHVTPLDWVRRGLPQAALLVSAKRTAHEWQVGPS